MARVRPYEPRDRESVRKICFETGMMGEPIDYQWPDLESFADMFTLYYTDYEPENSFVLEMDSKVVGYLNGAVDGSKAFNPLKIAVSSIFKKKLYLNPTILKTVARVGYEGIFLLAMGKLKADVFHDLRWPAHLHINILSEARGQGGGSQLINAYFDKLRKLSITGCYLETLKENTNAINFFQSMGFRKHGDTPLIPGWRDRSGNKLHSQVMVRDLV